MERLVTLLHHVSKNNPHPDFRTVYLDPQHRVALAGYRRRYDLGDCLAMVTSSPHNQQDFTFSTQPGVMDYMNNRFTPEQGLFGQTTADGRREIVSYEVARDKFARVLHDIGREPHRVLFNPNEILQWIEFVLNKNARQTMENLKINMHVLYGITAEGLFPAKVGYDQAGNLVAWLTTRHGLEPCIVEPKETVMRLQDIVPEQFYWVKPLAVVNRQRFVAVMESYSPHIRLAVQELRQGFMSPDDPIRYTVWDSGPDAKILRHGINKVQFINRKSIDALDPGMAQYYGSLYPEGQPKVSRNPMITFDLDTFYRGMTVMNPALIAEMRFKDSMTGVYMRGEAPDYGLTCEVIMGPTIPERNGRVCTE